MTSDFSSFRNAFRACANASDATNATRFFKTGPGDYGEGDKFLGIRVPMTRSFLPVSDALNESEVLHLVRSEWHEERLLGLLILVRRFTRARRDEATREHIVKLYLANMKWVNNWDLVDTSAPHILGAWLLGKDHSVLWKLAKSRSLWEQRIAVLATQAFIRAGEFAETQALCQHFLTHRHDLMHKACGWMLREMGKAHVPSLTAFLDANVAKMPRTMLRYAIEKLTPAQREYYLEARA